MTDSGARKGSAPRSVSTERVFLVLALRKRRGLRAQDPNSRSCATGGLSGVEILGSTFQFVAGGCRCRSDGDSELKCMTRGVGDTGSDARRPKAKARKSRSAGSSLACSAGVRLRRSSELMSGARRRSRYTDDRRWPGCAGNRCWLCRAYGYNGESTRRQSRCSRAFLSPPLVAQPSRDTASRAPRRRRRLSSNSRSFVAFAIGSLLGARRLWHRQE